VAIRDQGRTRSRRKFAPRGHLDEPHLPARGGRVPRRSPRRGLSRSPSRSTSSELGASQRSPGPSSDPTVAVASTSDDLLRIAGDDNADSG
jgi:hypothetical protein